MSYASPTSRSRLDLLYTSQSAVEGLHRAMMCAALAWCPELSRHRPVSFRREVPQRSAEMRSPLLDQVLEHPEWPRLVSLAWQDLLKDEPDASP
eukprot:2712907-Pyramimonas_sp.AAC.1